MPNNELIKRNYNYDDLKMLEKSQVFHDSFVKDKADFITAFPMFEDPFASDFQDAITAANALPDNLEVVQGIGIITEQIDIQMELARKAMQKLLLYVRVAFDKSKQKSKVFGSDEFIKAYNNPFKMRDLLEKANRLAEISENKTALLAAGYSQPDIDGLLTISEELGEKITEREDLKSERLTKTEERLTAYNLVWSYLVKISEASKVVYSDSPAKLHEYLLYPNSKIKNEEIKIPE
jgi:hypothetical protein